MGPFMGSNNTTAVQEHKLRIRMPKILPKFICHHVPSPDVGLFRSLLPWAQLHLDAYAAETSAHLHGSQPGDVWTT